MIGRMTRSRGRPHHDDILTPAEWRTVHAVQHGMSNRTIAARRGISVNAVKYHLRNVFAKLGIGDRGRLKRWFDVPKGSALAGERAMKGTLELGAIGQISRSVRDIDEAKRFYGDVLGLRHLYTFGKLAFFDCGGTRLFLTQESATPGPESVLYLRVPDIQHAYHELCARGVAFEGAPHMIHRHADGIEEWMAFFKDPEGRLLAIMAQLPQRQSS